MIAHAEAELRWLDRTERRLGAHPEHAMALELATERPKRGRPGQGARRLSARHPVVLTSARTNLKRDFR